MLAAELEHVVIRHIERARVLQDPASVVVDPLLGKDDNGPQRRSVKHLEEALNVDFIEVSSESERGESRVAEH